MRNFKSSQVKSNSIWLSEQVSFVFLIAFPTVYRSRRSSEAFTRTDENLRGVIATIRISGERRNLLRQRNVYIPKMPIDTATAILLCNS